VLVLPYYGHLKKECLIKAADETEEKIALQEYGQCAILIQLNKTQSNASLMLKVLIH
jgi:hypothetical protein